MDAQAPQTDASGEVVQWTRKDCRDVVERAVALLRDVSPADLERLPLPPEVRVGLGLTALPAPPPALREFLHRVASSD